MKAKNRNVEPLYRIAFTVSEKNTEVVALGKQLPYDEAVKEVRRLRRAVVAMLMPEDSINRKPA